MTALKQRSAYAAAAHILRTPTLSYIVDGKLNDDRQFILWEEIIDRYRGFSGGEKALVNIALMLDDRRPVEPTSIKDALINVDDACWERVVEALLALRPLGSVRSASSIADEAIGLFLERLSDAGIRLIEDDNVGNDADPNDTLEVRSEAVQEIREGMAVREEDIR